MDDFARDPSPLVVEQVRELREENRGNKSLAVENENTVEDTNMNVSQSDLCNNDTSETVSDDKLRTSAGDDLEDGSVEVTSNISQLVHTDSESSSEATTSSITSASAPVIVPGQIDTEIAVAELTESELAVAELPESELAVDDLPESEKSKVPEPVRGTSEDTPPSCSTDGVEVLDNPSIYQVKWVGWKGGRSAIITQNDNGPCPLLSILNVLLLQGKLCLPDGCEVISAEQLLEYLGDLLLSLPSPKVAPAPDPSNNTVLDFQHNMNDAIAILPKLQTGLDVNVKFTGVEHFEYTPECIIFDLLDISLYHGWLVDPQTEEAVAVGGNSYNQLVELVISARSGDKEGDSMEVSRAMVAAQFLENSASQLTYHGLCELNSGLSDGELAVFFRNNHFSTLYKTGEELFLLVTDQGFLHQENVVWETLENIEGDTEFVDQEFKTVQQFKERAALSGKERLEQDHILAVSLQREDDAGRDRDTKWEAFKDKHLGNTEGLTDEELAAKLQEAENLAAAQEEAEEQGEGQGGSRREEGGARRGDPNNPIGPRNAKKDKSCVLL